jgi:hypothetical protein
MSDTLKKAVIIGAVIIGVFAIAAVILVLVNSKNSPSGSTNTIAIRTPQGTINVRNYTQNPVATTTDALIMESNSEYQILNYKIDNSFLITLLLKPLSQSRSDAQAVFIKDLGISQTQACALNVSVKVPNSVDSDFSGNELGMSYCQNAIQIP